MSDNSPTGYDARLMLSYRSSTPYTDATKITIKSKRIPRPMNSFMLWSKDERARIREHYPRLPNAEISKLLGMQWRCLGEEVKTSYQRRAQELRKLHSLEFPDYKFRPRRRVSKVPNLEEEHNYGNRTYAMLPADEPSLFGDAPARATGEYGSLMQNTLPSPRGVQGNPSPESGFNDDFTEETDRFDMSILSPAVKAHSRSFDREQLSDGTTVLRDDEMMLSDGLGLGSIQSGLERPNSYEMFDEFAITAVRKKFW